MKHQFIAEPCPMCDEGTFKPQSDGTYKFKHARKEHVVKEITYAKCDHCGTSGYLKGQRAFNQQIIKEYQAKLPDYVSPSDILAVREKYELTQQEANLLFGGGKQGFSKWERGITEPAGPTARLIKLALSSIDSMCELAKMANLQIPACEKHSLQEKVKTISEAMSVNVVVHITRHYGSTENQFEDQYTFGSEKWGSQNPAQISNYLN